MKTLSAPVSDEMDEKVKRRRKRAGYQTVAEYLRSLIREDLERDEDEQLFALLLTDDGQGGSAEERLAALQAQFRMGIEDLEAGRVVDGPAAVVRVRQRLADNARNLRKEQARKA